CLQDIHWFDGAWGYFPTYTLGAMTAAQLYAAACAQETVIRPALAKGDFRPLVNWLRENVHCHGSSLSADEILCNATGHSLDPGQFKLHLKERYLAID
ncbi:MAG: carboxypeptidase M32, partial [Kiloniellales bacterium]|nr:carboxypeptidase M32 [Kiloniellales bacterium]